MNKAPDEVIKAVLKTLAYATVYCRNITLKNDVDIGQVNEIMEAIHDLPDQMYHWNNDDGLERIKLHLSCFDHEKWENSPNFYTYFLDALQRG